MEILAAYAFLAFWYLIILLATDGCPRVQRQITDVLGPPRNPAEEAAIQRARVVLRSVK